MVAAPEPDALREAAYFVERLTEDEMPLAGLVVNRASPPLSAGLSAEEAHGRGGPARGGRGDSTTAGLLRLHADRARHRDARGAPARAVRRRAPRRRRRAVVPALATDVHDLEGLRRVGELLAGG